MIGDRIAGVTSSWVMSTSIGNFDCDAEMLLTVTENPGDTTGGVSNDPGAELELDPASIGRAPADSFTLTGCTDTVPFWVVNGATASGTWHGISSAPVDGLLTLNAVSFLMTTTTGSCAYGGSLLTAEIDEAGQALRLENDSIRRTGGSFICPSSAQVSASFDLDAFDALDDDLSDPLGPVTFD